VTCPHLYDHTDLNAELICCELCGTPADARTRRKLRRQLKRLKAANAVLRRVGGGG